MKLIKSLISSEHCISLQLAPFVYVMLINKQIIFAEGNKIIICSICESTTTTSYQ